MSKIVASLAVCLLFFVSGYALRGLQAEVVTKTAEAAVAKEQVAVVTQARTDDKLTQVGAQASEQIRVDQAADTQKKFQIIYQDVIRYVQSTTPDPACDAGAEWLRIWNESNKGADAESVRSGRAAGTVPEGHGATANQGR